MYIIVNQVIKAIGGREAIGKRESLAVVADCIGPNGAFVTRVSSLRPDKVLFQQESVRGVTELMVVDEEMEGNGRLSN